MRVSRRLERRPHMVAEADRVQESSPNSYYDVVDYSLLSVLIHISSPAVSMKAWSALQHAQMRTRLDHTWLHASRG
jgi:hypothetical protein